MWFDSWAGILRVLLVGTAAYAGVVFLLRMSGKRTLGHPTQEAVNLVVSDADDTLPVSIPAAGKVEFGDSRLVLSSTEARAGARTDLTIQAKSMRTGLTWPCSTAP